MLENVKRITEIISPPDTATGPSGSWEDVEKELGLELPEDYKQFVSLYGSGTISGMISIGNPFIQPVSAQTFWLNWVDIYRDIENYGTEVPFDLYPARPALLPCGNYADVNILNWLTNESQAEWRIIYYSHSKGFFDLGKTTLTSVLLSLLTDVSDLPDGMVDQDPLYGKQPEFIPGFRMS
ncbi:SMI1/KNR4 family protein [Bremerella sp. T1]|uniref:SMI1/KNR4 family protein n=1 Tax=Bremerella sp. TYQ1 TaxID=3119568 RepID=UPI001CD03DC0|nr:SMI1/KNR4 family protein [Bremerella volcania]UBM37683.1 SMI1/KNR4 family protein [Bremerella volcania]